MSVIILLESVSRLNYLCLLILGSQDTIISPMNAERENEGQNPGREKKERLSSTSKVVRALAKPKDSSKPVPGEMAYPTDTAATEIFGDRVNHIDLSQKRSRIAAGRVRFAERLLRPDRVSEAALKENERDIEHIIILYPGRIFTKEELIRLLERPDGAKVNISAIQNKVITTTLTVFSPPALPIQPVQPASDPDAWKNWDGPRWFKDVQRMFDEPYQDPHMGEGKPPIFEPVISHDRRKTEL